MTLTTRSFADCRESRDVGPADGIYFVGHPAWLTEEKLTSLQQEAARQRVSAEHIRAQYFGDIGPVAEELMASAGLREFVTANSAPARPSGFANYRYYDIPESQVRPHVDNDNFALNVIIMLAHVYGAERRSGLLLFPRGPDDPVAIGLEPGEVILFNARDVIHARTPISDDGRERAVNLGIGFTPQSPLVGYRYWHPETGWHDGL
jgi:hypothetical protein